MKIEEVRRKGKEELNKIFLELTEKARKFRFDIAAKQVKNVREIRSVKKDIAKILTVLRERELKGK